MGSLVMFGMGVTLTAGQFRDVLRRPRLLALGAALLVDLVLVGASPGGTASNVICYLARGDLALSITQTSVSTLLAVVLTPLLTLLYVGERVPVPEGDMVSILQVVLAPVALGFWSTVWRARGSRPSSGSFRSSRWGPSCSSSPSSWRSTGAAWPPWGPRPPLGWS